MIPTDFTRDDCKLGDRRISYKKLCLEYKCRQCGSRVWGCYDAWYDQPWRIACRCKQLDLVTNRRFAQSRADAIEATDGLPAEFLATVKGE